MKKKKFKKKTPDMPEYDYYYYLFEDLFYEIEENLGLEATDEIVCNIINDYRRKVLIRDDFDNTNTIHWRTDK